MDKLSFFDRALFDDNRWAMVPYYVAQELVKYDDLVIKHMDDRPADRGIYCMYRSDGENSGLANLFEDYANAYLLEQYGIQVNVFTEK